MRIKLSFQKAVGNSDDGLIPIHHQHLLSDIVGELIKEYPQEPLFCFSSLKGTSKVADGHIRFLSTKVTWVFTTSANELLDIFLKKLFEKKMITLGSLSLIPKSYQVIGEPQFETEKKYICISPYVPCYQKGTEITEALDPSTHEFSDKAFECQMLRMERAGYSEEQLNSFTEFEITPDLEYFKKVQNSAKRFPRLYKNKNDEMVYGYLFPFFVHAHPDVHKFIWENGIGQCTNEGYGMLDTVPETPPVTDHITP